MLKLFERIYFAFKSKVTLTELKKTQIVLNEKRLEFEQANKLSEIVLLACDDLEAVNQSPLYKIDFHTWHNNLGDVCCVCFAGAVLANRDYVDYTDKIVSCFLNRYVSDTNTEDKMYALDSFRRGEINAALADLNIKQRVSPGLVGELKERFSAHGVNLSNNKGEVNKLIREYRKAAYQLQDLGF